MPPRANRRHDADAPTDESNKALGITKAPLLAPFVFHEPDASANAANSSISDKKLFMPDEVGEEGKEAYEFEGCAFAMQQCLGELVDQCAADDNLRTTAEDGVKADDLFLGKTRVQMLADAMKFSGRTGCAQQILRVTDTKYLHNNPRWSETVGFVFGGDDSLSMKATAGLGGDEGLHGTIEKGVRVTVLDDSALPAAALDEENELFKPFSKIQVDIDLSIPRADGTTTDGLFIIGGDAASAAALSSIVAPNDQSNPCDQCVVGKRKFHDDEAGRKALRRNYAIGTALSHLNPLAHKRLGKRKREIEAEEVRSRPARSPDA
eukprot:812960-Prymnesium_polylepis.1